MLTWIFLQNILALPSSQVHRNETILASLFEHLRTTTCCVGSQRSYLKGFIFSVCLLRWQSINFIPDTCPDLKPVTTFVFIKLTINCDLVCHLHFSTTVLACQRVTNRWKVLLPIRCQRSFFQLWFLSPCFRIGGSLPLSTEFFDFVHHYHYKLGVFLFKFIM